ncbi:MAG TPA: rubrerythrin family protein [Deltaproteobacteria bacterium]|nr:rubrerythrin family protein [Deltaproteobacteria bacterium]
MTKSMEFLKEAFKGESQAHQQYEAFAERALQDGYPQAARLFRAAAQAETVHAINHLKALGSISDTRDNLLKAVSGETHEFEHMYPEMLQAAIDEKNRQAERTFRYALEVEKIHAALYANMLDALESGQEEYPYYICPVCGYTAEKKAPGQCPVCGALGNKFREVA